MPLLKREPEIWPPHLFGEPGGEAAAPTMARAAASVQRRPRACGDGPTDIDRW